MSVAILGPTFQDLATNVNRNISSLSLIFVGRAFGYLSGSVIGGVLLDAMNHFLLLGKYNTNCSSLQLLWNSQFVFKT